MLRAGDRLTPSRRLSRAMTLGLFKPECPRLYDRINADALNKVFSNRDGGQITFEYADCQVTVHGDSAVTVTPTDTF